jgi:bleomycin hydrolase
MSFIMNPERDGTQERRAALKRILRPMGLAVLALTVAAGPACKRQAPSKAEQVAEKLGRDEAVYIKRTAGGGQETVLAMDFARVVRPNKVWEFTQLAHLPPVRQGKTGTCWSFSTTSFLESELRRMGKAEVKLSEMFIVYWEYVEKARRFIRERGNSFLGQGSEPNSAMERVRQYGIVREQDYLGLKPGRAEHDHRALFREFEDVLKGLKARDDWDEAKGLAGVRAVLNRHLGSPPESITVDGRSLTPKQYLEGTLGLKPADYVAFISFAYAPFYTRSEYKVPDNWWHCANYFNLPLYEFPLALLRALRRGYTAVLAVDFTEPGYSGENGIAVIPSFDIPQNFIDQSSREYRFTAGVSTDDHAVHCVGYKEGKEIWYLIKDSWENAYWSEHKGYFFYRDDYIRLKCLMFMVHQDAVKEVLAEFR